MKTRETYDAVPWWSVLLAVVPGVWLALSRRTADELGLLLGIIGWAYLAILAIALPALWYRTRRFPVWALLPAGVLAWFALYLLATGISSLAAPFSPFKALEVDIVLIQGLVAAVLLIVLLGGRRLPVAVWGLIALLFAVNLLVILFVIYPTRQLPISDPIQLITVLGGPVEGLMLLAVGLLAVRSHKVLALLVVLGGYGYLLSDTDYLFGYSLRNWSGLTPYLIAMVILYMVVTPVGFMRARSRLSRALALFVPVTAFAALRLVVPWLVVGSSVRTWPGDVLISVNLILVLATGWLMYDHLGTIQAEVPVDEPLLTPSTG
ncbi:MAG: hypothetical protein R6X18_17665 [Chloroflexota bacterium]|jgi:hypothetical protein